VRRFIDTDEAVELVAYPVSPYTHFINNELVMFLATFEAILSGFRLPLNSVRCAYTQ